MQLRLSVVCLTAILCLRPLHACETDKDLVRDFSKAIHTTIFTFDVETRGRVAADGRLPHGFEYDSLTGDIKVTRLLTDAQYVLQFKCTQSGVDTKFTMTVKDEEKPTTTKLTIRPPNGGDGNRNSSFVPSTDERVSIWKISLAVLGFVVFVIIIVVVIQRVTEQHRPAPQTSA